MRRVLQRRRRASCSSGCSPRRPALRLVLGPPRRRAGCARRTRPAVCARRDHLGLPSAHSLAGCGSRCSSPGEPEGVSDKVGPAGAPDLVECGSSSAPRSVLPAPCSASSSPAHRVRRLTRRRPRRQQRVVTEDFGWELSQPKASLKAAKTQFHWRRAADPGGAYKQSDRQTETTKLDAASVCRSGSIRWASSISVQERTRTPRPAPAPRTCSKAGRRLPSVQDRHRALPAPGVASSTSRRLCRSRARWSTPELGPVHRRPEIPSFGRHRWRPRLPPSSRTIVSSARSVVENPSTTQASAQRRRLRQQSRSSTTLWGSRQFRSSPDRLAEDTAATRRPLPVPSSSSVAQTRSKTSSALRVTESAFFIRFLGPGRPPTVLAGVYFLLSAIR